MERYKNLSGNSDIIGYSITTGAISVKFNDDSVYLYTDLSTGAHNVAEMQRLARLGRGLNHFINQNVRKRYASKIS